jgi:AcrR family transcriptional regulator
MMVRPTLKQKTPNLQEAIKETAWKQIAQEGAPALSLRAIARELRITAPAIYNYFPRRDDLVTALIIDAYTSFGDSQLAARDAVPPEDLKGRMKAIGLAYRAWAHTYPQRYQLIFGAPIPGYEAPMEKVFPSSARSISALFSVVEAIYAAGRLNVGGVPAIQDQYQAQYEMWKDYFRGLHPVSLFTSMIIWARVHGIVSLEIQGNLCPFGEKGDALYLFELDSVARQFIKEQ